jgi:radical SAM protein with 4Fe4S-binding SPASM domain
MRQVNIHFMVAEETYQQALETIEDIKTDKRLARLNALVFMSMKPVGRAKDRYNPISKTRFDMLISLCQRAGINFGGDSCSAYKILDALTPGKRLELKDDIEPCEATLFSSYFNVEGKYFPCSFMEEGMDGIPITEETDFVQDVWHHPSTEDFRKRLLATAKSNDHKCRTCPEFRI